MKFKICLSLLLIGRSGVALAEGGCPEGQYPQETQQARLCVPIPGASGSSGGSSGLWENRYGAIAEQINGPVYAASNGEKSESKAKRVAMKLCKQGGTKGCKITAVYWNQCIALVDSKGYWRVNMASSTRSQAEEKAMEYCENNGGVGCRLDYSDCSNMERIR